MNRQPPSPERHPKPPAVLEVGQRIAQVRRQRGLSQVQLGRLVGVNSGTISRIESDDPAKAREPSRTLLRALARVLGVPAHFLEYGVPMAVYVLIRTTDLSWETVAAFTDQQEADDWAAAGEAGDVDGGSYHVHHVPINDTETLALFAAERLADHAPQPKEAAA